MLGVQIATYIFVKLFCSLFKQIFSFVFEMF